MAGASIKARKHAAKMRAKAAAKAVKKAAYFALRGTSKKTKRQGKTSLVAGVFKHAHIMRYCGNPGCIRCFPQFAWKRANLA